MIKKTIENKYFLKFVKLATYLLFIATYLLFIVFMILILLYQIFYHFKLKKHFKKYHLLFSFFIGFYPAPSNPLPHQSRLD